MIDFINSKFENHRRIPHFDEQLPASNYMGVNVNITAAKSPSNHTNVDGTTVIDSDVSLRTDDISIFWDVVAEEMLEAMLQINKTPLRSTIFQNANSFEPVELSRLGEVVVAVNAKSTPGLRIN